MFRGYLLIESLPPGFTATERRQAWDATHSIGRQDTPDPNRNNHTRLRLDDLAQIVEAEFEDSEITRTAVVAVIAQAVGLPEEAIDATLDYTIFAQSGEWEQSRLACVGFIAANVDAWDAPDGA